MNKGLGIYTLVVGVVFYSYTGWATGSEKDEALLWEAVRLAQPEYIRGMVETNEVIEQVYRELDIQQELAAEAVRRGIGERIAVRQDVETARRNVLIAALAADIRAEAPKPDDDEVRSFYESDPSLFVLPERYQLDVIQLDSEDSAAVAAGKALNGELAVEDDDFFAVKGQIVVTQRDGGWVTQPRVAPVIWHKLPLMKQGQVMFFEIDTGTFLIRRGLYGASAQMTYEQAYDLIYQQLLLRKQDEYWQAYLEGGEFGSSKVR